MADQFTIFSFSLILGAFLGLIYDIFRLFRIICGASWIKTFFQDLGYCIFSSIFTFLFMLAFNDGEIRFYVIAGEAMGFCIYYITLSRLFIFAAKCVIKLVRTSLNKMKRFFLPKLNFVKVTFLNVFSQFFQVFIYLFVIFIDLIKTLVLLIWPFQRKLKDNCGNLE